MMTLFFLVVAVIVVGALLIAFGAGSDPPTKPIHYDARYYEWPEYGPHAIIFEGPDRRKPTWTVVRSNVADEKMTFYTVIPRNPLRPIQIGKVGLGRGVILNLGEHKVPSWLYGKRKVQVFVHNHDPSENFPIKLTPKDAPETTDAWRNA